MRNRSWLNSLSRRLGAIRTKARSNGSRDKRSMSSAVIEVLEERKLLSASPVSTDQTPGVLSLETLILQAGTASPEQVLQSKTTFEATTSTVTPPPTGGLVINATFDSTITNDPNAAAIEAAINRGIAIYEARIADNITINIKFAEMTTGLGQSSTWVADQSYSTFRSALASHSTTATDATALAHLPNQSNDPVQNGANIHASTANWRVLGTNYTTPDGFDGTISLNTSITNFDRITIDPSKYDLQAVAEHEIDEVLGLGSGLDHTSATRPEDLFRYDASGNRSYTTDSGAASYFSIDGTADLARFNQTSGGDYGDWFSTAAHTPQVQDAFGTPGATPNLNVELTALDAIGYNLLPPITDLPGNPTGSTGTMMLLTDGTVIAQGPGATWEKLTPDASGNYASGTWSSIASMGTGRLYTGMNVLPDGRVLIIGGEYSGASMANNWTNTGEIYDPVANSWTAIANFPQSQFGDDPTVLLPNGKILAGYLSGPQTYLYDPGTNTWTQTGDKLRGDRSDEETWSLLPDGSVLSLDVFNPGHAQRYVPSTGTWVDAGTVPVTLTSNTQGFEMGPGTLLPDGRYLQIGANENTAIYTPSTNTWVAGPTLPSGMGADDAPGAMMPNGHFIFMADSYLFHAPTKMFDFDYTTNTLTDITPTSGTLATTMANNPCFTFRMLVTPNGHVLISSTSSATAWDYTPGGSPNDAWRPTIAGVVQNTPTTYTLSGTQLTGISEGASYGDDAEMSTNYPIVRVTNVTTGAVGYARTTGWTPSVASGAAVTTVNFTLPSGFAPGGNYTIAVIASGIASTEFVLNTAVQSSVHYTASPHAYEAIDLQAGQPGVFTIVDNTDDGGAAIDLGTNTFNFYGTTYTGTQLFANANGLISFNAAVAAFSNTDLSSSPTGSVIAPYWDDLRTDVDSSDMVLGKIDGNRLIVEWSNVHTFASSTSPITFQAILQLNTGGTAGNVIFNYVDTVAGNANDNGASATVGIKSDGSNVLVSYNSTSPLIGSGEAIQLSVDQYVASAYPYEALNLEPGQAGVFTVLDNSDDGGAAIDLGSNTFTFYGKTYTGTELFANVNGLISFDGANAAYTNTDLSSQPAGPVIAPLWDDYRTDLDATDMVLGKIDGNRLIIEWSQIHTFAASTSTMTFQAILQLNTGSTAGDITFNYPDVVAGNSADNGGSATVGVKPDYTTSAAPGTLVSFNSTNALIGNGKAIQLAVDHSVQVNGSTLTVNGTPQNDNIIVSEGTNVGVTLNGIPYHFNTGLTNVVVHGNGGTNDSLSFSGTPGDDTVTLRPRSLLASGTGYSVQADSVETIHVYSAGGANDRAFIYDSAGNDTLIAKPTFAQMQGAGYLNYVSNFDKVYTYSTTPGDLAYLYDSAGNDMLTSTPVYSLLHGTTFYNYAQGFGHVYAYASTGTDSAALYDSAGNDTFIGAPTYAQMIGANYSNYASGFDQVNGYASTNAGGVGDVAKLFDSAGNDTVVGRPTYTQMSGTGYLNQANSFGHVYAYATAGGTDDRAYLYDSAGNDTFYSTPVYSQLSGPGYFNYVSKFDKVYAYASTNAGGVGDQANLLDSAGNDTFTATPTYAQMTGPGYFNYASKFGKVQAFASTNAGGVGDRANLFDSAGNDTFVGTPTYGLLKGTAFYNYAQGFTQVSGYATAGGNDTANLYDSAGNDTFYGRTNYARLTGTGFYDYVSGFAHVNAYANAGGNDTLDVHSITYDFHRFGSWEHLL